MVGDLLFALSTYPIHIVLEWWRNGLGYLHDLFQSNNFLSDLNSEVNSSEVASSLLASSGQLPLEELTHLKDIDSIPQMSNGIDNHLGQLYELGASSSKHQIWHPPRSSDSDIDSAPLEAGRTLRPTDEPSHAEQIQFDERRQFPSAHPSTPNMSMSLTSTTVSRSLYPPIPEENSRQGFQKSPLPPREPLNPSPVGCLGDNFIMSGISSFMTSQLANANDADDSMSTDGYENDDEDDFDVTLKTPLRPRGSVRSRPHPRLFVVPPSTSVSSALFSPSRSSALTTVDNGSPLRTDTDSSLSASINIVPSTVIGKKRSFPRTRSSIAKNRVREIKEPLHPSNSRQSPRIESDERRSPDISTVSHGLQCLASASTSDDVGSTSITEDSNTDGNDQDQSPPEEKRRKIMRPPRTKAIKSSRTAMQKFSSYASPPRTRSRSRLQVSKSNSQHRSELPALLAKKRFGKLKTTKQIEPMKNSPSNELSASIVHADKDISDVAPLKANHTGQPIDLITFNRTPV